MYYNVLRTDNYEHEKKKQKMKQASLQSVGSDGEGLEGLINQLVEDLSLD